MLSTCAYSLRLRDDCCESHSEMYSVVAGDGFSKELGTKRLAWKTEIPPRHRNKRTTNKFNWCVWRRKQCSKIFMKIARDVDGWKQLHTPDVSLFMCGTLRHDFPHNCRFTSLRFVVDVVVLHWNSFQGRLERDCVLHEARTNVVVNTFNSCVCKHHGWLACASDKCIYVERLLHRHSKRKEREKTKMFLFSNVQLRRHSEWMKSDCKLHGVSYYTDCRLFILRSLRSPGGAWANENDDDWWWN